MIQPRLRPALLGLAYCLAHAFGCSSADEADKAKSPITASDKRDTTIIHDPCDGTSSSAQKVDVNGDGKFDITHVTSGGREVCRIVDLNMDGVPDAFIYYDEQGRERRRESDFDRDGRADEIAIFEAGALKLKLRETNFDDKIDTWDHYDSGRLARRERDSDGDGIIDQWWTFNNPNNPKCATVATDRNADGKPDADSVVDLCGESYAAPKAVASAVPSVSPVAPPASAAPAPPRPSAAPAAAPSASAAPSATPKKAPKK